MTFSIRHTIMTTTTTSSLDPPLTEGTIKLSWRPLRRLSEFDPDERKHLGLSSVYIWGFVHQNVFIPYYIGQTAKPCERAMQHYSNLRGGLYPIYHRNSLAGFHLYKDDHMHNRVDPHAKQGMLYTPASPRAMGSWFTNPNVQEEVRYLLEGFRFAYASIKEPKGESPQLVERALADRFGRKFLQSTVATKDSDSTSRLHCRLQHRSEGRTDALIEKLKELEDKYPPAGMAEHEEREGVDIPVRVAWSEHILS